MSDVNDVMWNVSIYLVREGDSFEVGYKTGDPATFVVEKRFVDLKEARNFAKKLAVHINENAFMEIHGRFEDGGHAIFFLE